MLFLLNAWELAIEETKDTLKNGKYILYVTQPRLEHRADKFFFATIFYFYFKGFLKKKLAESVLPVLIVHKCL